MTNTSLVQVRIDPELKNDVGKTLAANGLDIPTAIRMYFAKIQQVGGIPFEVRLYNAETISAMEEANRIAGDPTSKTFYSFSEVLDDCIGEDTP